MARAGWMNECRELVCRGRGKTAMLVQNISDRSGSYDVGSRTGDKPGCHSTQVKCIGELASSGALVFSDGNPASRQTRSHGFVSDGLTPVDVVVLVSRAPWASNRLRSARQGLHWSVRLLLSL